jgi:heme-degrading monooxygenase HmoA
MKRRVFWFLGAMTLLIGAGRALPLVQARPAASATAAGYAVIRRYHVKAGAAGEIAQRARSGFVPIISQTPGFVAWYLVDAGKDTLIAVSIFKDQAGAQESTKRAAQWIKQNLAALIPNPPEIASGAVLVQKVQ